MNKPDRPTIGLALSGSGNRSTFYIGFLEGLEYAGVPVDCISAMSGASIIAAAYASGGLEDLKKRALTLTKKNIRNYITESKDKSGLYSLKPMEEYLYNLCKGKRFEELPIKMAFVAADLDTGEQVVLCMGDVARAACISCTLPTVFEVTKWGGHTLVDGGLLNDIPLDVLKDWDVDILIGLNLRGTLGIFGEGLVKLRKMHNAVKKFLHLNQVASWAVNLMPETDEDFSEKPGLLKVLSKSLDLAIRTRSRASINPVPDLEIIPDMDHIKDRVLDFNDQSLLQYYELGLKTAEQNAPKIKQIMAEKAKRKEKVL